METWVVEVKCLEGISRKFPQTAYSGLKMSLHKEWQFVQCVNPGFGTLFLSLEEVLRDGFLTDLLRGKERGVH